MKSTVLSCVRGGGRYRPLRLTGLIVGTPFALAGCSTTPVGGSVPAASVRSTAEPDTATIQLIASGRSQVLPCSFCHVVDSAAPPPFGDSPGPHLEDIVGRASGSVRGFAYKDELKTLDLVWDEAILDRRPQQAQAMVPEMCEPFLGMGNPDHRKALIAFLKNSRD